MTTLARLNWRGAANWRERLLSKEVEAAFEQLGVPVREGKEVAVDAIFDSVSVATTYRENWRSRNYFCSFGEAIHDHPELVRKYLGTVVPGMTTSLPRLMRR